MLSLVANIIAVALSLWTPPVAVVYASGAWRGTDACTNNSSHLPTNTDTQRPAISQAAPTVAARSVAILSDDGHVWLSAKDANRRQPLASITKLMTALVFLEHNPGWEQTYTIKRDDAVEGGKVNLFLGETVSVKDLFYASLVASDNGATLALARVTGLSDEDFVAAMNQKATDLGLMQTAFVDPIGLSNNNLSDAKDVARLAQVALNQPDIAAAAVLPVYSFNTQQGVAKHLEATDWLLDGELPDGLQALGGKTGYTDLAGYCFVGRFRDAQGRSVIVAVLDAGGKNERFRQARLLASWAFTYCQW